MDMDHSNEIFKYRWVLAICTSLVGFLTWGVLYCVGLFYVRWLEYFGTTKANTAIVGGLPTGTACILGPFYGFVIHRIGFRKTGVIGGAIMSFSHIVSAFAPNLLYLGIMYGFLTGIGAGMCHLSASIAINHYFFKQRSLAEGFMATGVGIGTFLFSIVIQKLIDTYDWRGSLAIVGAATAHLIILFQLIISPSYLKRFPLLRGWKSSPVGQKRRKWRENEDRGDLVVERSTEVEPENSIHDYELQSTKNLKGNRAHESKKSWIGQCWELATDPVFLLLLVSDSLCWISTYVPYVHLAERSRLEGMSATTTAWISSTIGISGIFGRSLISAIPSIWNVCPFYLYGFTNALLGVLTICSPFYSTKTGLFLYAGLFGALGTCTPLGKASAASLLGNDAFNLAYSWMLLFEGLGVCFGPIIAGWIYDTTQSYDNSFFFMGAGLLCSGVLTLFKRSAFRLQRYFRARKCQNTEERVND